MSDAKVVALAWYAFLPMYLAGFAVEGVRRGYRLWLADRRSMLRRLAAENAKRAEVLPEDWAAIGGDFRAVGDDMRAAMRKYAEENGLPAPEQQASGLERP